MQAARMIYLTAVAWAFTACNPDKVDTSSTPIVAQIDVSVQRQPMSKHMYGMFMEHLGNADVGDLVDDGLSAEVMDDRKFFYPVDTVEVQVPVNKRDRVNQWVPANRALAVSMDSINPYVGVHSPKINVDAEISEGIAQSGLAIVAGKMYTGRIVLLGSPGVNVNVSLIWGEGPSDRATYSIDRLSANYSKYYFSLHSKINTNKARLEILGTGEGTFSVGAVSLLPEGHVSGFRPDVIRLLRELNSGLYRWGGNMISAFDWRDGIGDPDTRAPRYEHAWNGVENNDVGTHEILKFAELIGVEIALTVNAGLGDAYTAAQWVEYVNGSKYTPMGKLRAKNGRPEPFGVKLWCIGNEAYGWWQLGHTDLKSFIIKHHQFAAKMLEADPTIKLIGSGASIEEMSITGSAKRETGKILAEYDSASDWTGGLLRQASGTIDYMSEHFYCAVDQRFDSEQGKYIQVDEPLEDWTRRPANRIRAKAEHYKEYHRRIPGSKTIPVYLDEWAYFTNWVHPAPTLGVVMGYARGLHEMIRNSNLIRMAGFTFGTSCLSFSDTDVVYNASGLLFKLYQSQFGSIPVDVRGNSPQPKPKYPVGGDQPMVNAGGDAYPLDMVAALTNDKKALTIAVVNPTDVEQRITLGLNGTKVADKIQRWTITGTSTMARNLVGKEPQVIVKKTLLDPNETFMVQPASINIYRFEILN